MYGFGLLPLGPLGSIRTSSRDFSMKATSTRQIITGLPVSNVSVGSTRYRHTIYHPGMVEVRLQRPWPLARLTFEGVIGAQDFRTGTSSDAGQGNRC